MALYTNFHRIMHRSFLRLLGSVNLKQCDKNIHEKSVVLDMDALDNFTSQLIQKKIDKWSTLKPSQKIISDGNVTTSSTSNQDIEQLQMEKINCLFQDATNLEDNVMIMCLVKQCIKYRKCPSLSNLNYVLSLCAQNGDKQTIVEIEELCEEFYPAIIKANSHFRHYLAEAVWIRGNVPESLKIFKEVYQENAFLRRRIRLMFKFLIFDVISSRSEATLINIIRFSEDLLKEYNDFFPLTCIWQACFLSEWYTDQCLALKMLGKNDGLCKAVISKIPYVVSVSLVNHKTDVVYRLLEILLKFDMKTQYEGVLLTLLDYQIRQGDLHRCSEIIKWSMENYIEPSISQSEKFLHLLLSKNKRIDSIEDKSETKQQTQTGTNFKF